jgi:hypothetical protein
MMSKKSLLFAVAALLGSADHCAARTRQRHPMPFVSKRIQQRSGDDGGKVAFLRSESSQQQREEAAVKSYSPLTGWISDFSKAVKDDFAATADDSSAEVFHECVVNYSKGLMGNF